MVALWLKRIWATGQKESSSNPAVFFFGKKPRMYSLSQWCVLTQVPWVGATLSIFLEKMLGLNKAIWWTVVVAQLVEWSLPTPKICGSNPSKFYLSIVLHLNRKDKKRKSGWERPIFKKLNDHIIIKKESYLETYSVGREEGSGLTDKPKICESIGWKLLVFRWRRQWKNDLIWISDENSDRTSWLKRFFKGHPLDAPN